MQTESPEHDQHEEAQKKGRRTIVFTALVVLVLLGYAGAKTFETRTTQAADSIHVIARENTTPVFYDLPELLLDIRAPKSSRALLKLRLTVELENERDVSLIQRANPHILDALITMLRGMPLDDLEGPGLQRVQKEMLDIVQKRSAPANVRGVLFKELMVGSARSGGNSELA